MKLLETLRNTYKRNKLSKACISDKQTLCVRMRLYCEMRVCVYARWLLEIPAADGADVCATSHTSNINFIIQFFALYIIATISFSFNLRFVAETHHRIKAIHLIWIPFSVDFAIAWELTTFSARIHSLFFAALWICFDLKFFKKRFTWHFSHRLFSTF